MKRLFCLSVFICAAIIIFAETDVYELMNRADSLTVEGKTSEAMKILKNVKESVKKSDGEESTAYADVKYYEGRLYSAQMNKEEAEKSFKTVYDIYNKLTMKDNETMFLVCKNIGASCVHFANIELGLEYLKSAELFDAEREKDINSGEMNLQASYAHLMSDEYKDAVKYALKAISIYESIGFSDYADVAVAYEYIGNAKKQMKDDEGSKEALAKSAEIYKYLYGEESEDYKRVKNGD